ncbi:MAG TPA: DUF2950 domain-containing protein [Candidatus Acidoferrum sp.]|nr:DUF2950 domain-containing protein [Candidatus Acidoferrum sp.]
MKWANVRVLGVALVLMGAAVVLRPLPAMATDPKVFATPEEAAKALLDAAASDDKDAIWAVLGDAFRDQIENPDEAQERENRRRVVAGAKEALQLRADDDKTRVMVIGKEAWPMPIPIVKGDKGWSFDVGAGADEILARRIGADELATIDNLNAYVDAQVQYASEDRDGDDVLEYAQKINSTPGKKDGLYWEVPAGSGEEASPFGPFVAEKAAYLSDREPGDPFMGYYYRIITRQGENAPGGRYDYVINGNMIAGFAMIAWPADYGNSGVMTFIVNQNGRVYQKDLGEKTEVNAAAIQDYNPDSSWTEAKGKD